MGLGIELIRGTAVAPTWFIPVIGPQWQPNLKVLEDLGLRNDMNDFQGQVAGMRYDDISWKNNCFADTMPALMRAILGSTDAVTGTTPPYSHKIGLLNQAGTTQWQPPSYTIIYFDGLDQNQLTGSQLDTCNIAWTADGLLEASPKFITKISTIITTASTSFTQDQPIPVWDVVVNVAGSPITKAVSGEMVFARNAKPIPAATGTQNYYQNWAGPFSTKASKLTVVMESDTELNYFLNNTQGLALDLTFSNPASANESLQYHYSNVGWTLGKKNPGKEWMEVDLEYRGIPNTTDTVAGGRAPFVFTGKNSVSTQY